MTFRTSLRRVAPLALLAFGSAIASATDFTTVIFMAGDGSSTTPSLGETFTSSGDSYKAEFSNFVVNTQPYIDVQWTHKFDTSVTTATSAATNPYYTVTQTVSGYLRRIQGQGAVSATAVLSESITNLAGTPAGQNSGTFNVSGTVGPFATLPFTFDLTTPFTQPLGAGYAIKDDLVFSGDGRTEIVVTSITQRYTPVPEPATLLALGAGALGVIARRRRRA